MSEYDLNKNAIPSVTFGVAQGQKAGYLPKLHTHLFDGSARWVDRDGVLKTVAGFSECDEEEVRTAIATFVENGAGDEVFHTMLDHYDESLEANPGAKAFAVTNRQERAREMAASARERGFETRVAVSDDAGSMENIDEFKHDPRVQLLVGVGQIYEGLSVPAASHMFYGTHFRTYPHATQVCGRILRMDLGPMAPSPDEQIVHLFAPADPLLLELIEKIRAGDGHVAVERISFGDEPEPGPNRRPRRSTRGLASQVSGADVFDFITGSRISTAAIAKLLLEAGSPLSDEQREALDRTIDEPTPDSSAPPLTPRQQQDELRRAIEKQVRLLAADNAILPKDLNRQIKFQFNKSREHMSVEELQAVFRELPEIVKTLAPSRGGTDE